MTRANTNVKSKTERRKKKEAVYVGRGVRGGARGESGSTERSLCKLKGEKGAKKGVGFLGGKSRRCGDLGWGGWEPAQASEGSVESRGKRTGANNGGGKVKNSGGFQGIGKDDRRGKKKKVAGGNDGPGTEKWGRGQGGRKRFLLARLMQGTKEKHGCGVKE